MKENKLKVISDNLKLHSPNINISKSKNELYLMKLLLNLDTNYRINNCELNQVIRSNLQYHNCNINKFNKKIINDLLYDEKKHIVCIFKEYLILDDIVEFLQRFYFIFESKRKLTNIGYEVENSVILKPIYTPLECFKILYKNIKRHRKHIDQLNERIMRNDRVKTPYSNIINTNMDSILTKNGENTIDNFEIANIGSFNLNITNDHSLFLHYKNLTKVFIPHNYMKDSNEIKKDEKVLDKISTIKKKTIKSDKSKPSSIEISKTSRVSNLKTIELMMNKLKQSNNLKIEKIKIIKNQQNINTIKNYALIKNEIKKNDNKKKEYITNISSKSKGKKSGSKKTKDSNKISNFNSISDIKSIYNINFNLNLNLNLKMEKDLNSDRQSGSFKRKKFLKALNEDDQKNIPLSERYNVNENNSSINNNYIKNQYYKKYQYEYKDKRFSNQNESYMKNIKENRKYKFSRNSEVKNVIFNESQIKKKDFISDLYQSNHFKSIRCDSSNGKICSLSPKYIDLSNEKKNYLFKSKDKSYNNSMVKSKINYSKTNKLIDYEYISLKDEKGLKIKGKLSKVI